MSKNKKITCFFDLTYALIVEDIPIEDKQFIVRIEGCIIEESDTQYKFKTYNSFWSGYNTVIIEYPNNSYARANMKSPHIRSSYWLDKKRITFLK